MERYTLKYLYALFLVLCSVQVARAPEVRWVETCGNCIEYQPKHWEAEGFPAIIIIRRR